MRNHYEYEQKIRLLYAILKFKFRKILSLLKNAQSDQNAVLIALDIFKVKE